MRSFSIALIGLLLSACTGTQMIRVATSKHPARTMEHMVTHRGQAYKYNPMLAVHDARALRRNFKRLIDALKGNAGREWGKRETVVPSRNRYVKYTQNYQSRAIVDFDSGAIVVETVDTAHTTKSLHNAIVTTLLTPDDPRAVDLYSAKTVRLSGRPYLYGLVLDDARRPIDSPRAAARYSWYLRQHRLKTRTLVDGAKRKTVTYVRFRMVGDHLERAARKYEPLVDKYARRFGISKNLVFAIIKTESNFNPFAVSPAPAYGLMQLVPTSGGRDAFRKVHGRDGIPSKERLFDAANNIRLGTAYLNVLSREHLGAIRNPVAREYCTIAAYNTGTGNVLRTFSGDRGQAIRIINGMQPSAVYRRLRDHMGSAEARRYLVKVLHARREFVNIRGAPG